jgi:2-aminophenol/2-amino-5-chlorophenol 1,6-dioxygenase subunit beta
MSQKGQIVAGVLAPHPPHLVYGDNPPQNEARSECGWETLRWAYERLRQSLEDVEYDVLLVHSPHWRTQIATHFLGCSQFKSKSVDPIFPHLFRFNYDLKVDVELSRAICEQGREAGLLTQMMENPDFRIDYGTITSLHMTRPQWDKPIVGISSVGRAAYFSMDVMQEEMIKLGEATKKAIEASGKKCVLVASHSLSHRHFIDEPEIPEDMSQEHIYHHGQYLWDMKVIELMKRGEVQTLFDIMTDFTEQTISECDGGGLMWMLSAMGMPQTPAKIHGYGTVIGTGNVVAEWRSQ